MPGSVVLTPSGSGQTGVSTGHNLVTKVARSVGGEDEPNIRQQALDCLNRARIEFNQYDWHFTKTTDSPITLVAGTRTYSLESTFRKPAFAMLIDSNGDPFRTLEYRDDILETNLDEQLTKAGDPYFYWLRNDFGDGLVTVYPEPSASAASNYRLSVEYYPRIGAISDTDVQLALPEEAENVLVLGGQAYIMRERSKEIGTATMAFQDYQRAIQLLKTHDRRITSERSRFRLGTRRDSFDPSLYIRIA